MSTFDESQALAIARQARSQAYAPYSKFKVGAALILADGTIVPGCNVENASFGATVCAERTAILSAVAHGHKKFEGIVVVAEGDEAVPPCALCLQVMAEFFEPTTPVILADTTKVLERTTFKALLPHPFGPQSF